MIKKIKVVNFKCFESFETDVEKINALIGSNGKGKTSFLQALKWGLLGVFDKSYVKIPDKPVSVEITFESGNVINRTFADDKQTVRVNKSISTQKAANQIIFEAELHSSPEVVSAMFDSKDFESYANDLNSFKGFLLSFLPVKIRKETFFDFLKTALGRDFTPDEKKFFETELTKDDFTIDDIDVYYKTFYDKRKDANKEVKELKPKAEFDIKTLPKETKEELTKKYAALTVAETSAKEYQNKLKAYNDSVEQNKKALERKATLESKLKEFSEIKKPEKTMEVLKNEKAALMAEYEKTAKSLSSSDTILKGHKEAYFGFQKGTCPYKPDFQCPVNHEEIMKDILEQATKQRQISDGIEKELNKISEAIKNKDAEIDNLMTVSNKLIKAESLQEELNHLVIPAVLEKPEEIKIDDISSEKTEIESKIALYKKAEEAEEYRVKYAEAVAKAETLDLAVTLFSEKGVKTVILSKVFKPVEDIVNRKAAGIGDGYKVSLTDSNGFNPVVTINNKKPPVPFKLLSSGEFIIMCFTFMSAINEITKCGLLVLDNLDKLDKANTELLVKLIEADGSYDNVFLAGVDHSELSECKAIATRNLL